MRPLIQEIETEHTPETLARALAHEPGLILLRSGMVEEQRGRYSFVAVKPFVTFRSSGSRCEVRDGAQVSLQYGNPWQLIALLMARYEVADEVDFPLPLGGCFGYWGFELKNYLEPQLTRRVVNDLELPDCQVGFYASLVAFDHQLGKCWVIATGLDADGTRSLPRARAQQDFWTDILRQTPEARTERNSFAKESGEVRSNLSAEEFMRRVERALEYIRQGEIYQVSLAHRLSAEMQMSAWEFYERLAEFSPAPYAAYIGGEDFQIVSSSPELFLRVSGSQISTRPIKGTRPRASDATRDAQLGYELQTSAKERAELLMITDLLRNDLGRVCEYGTIQVPELMRLERYAQVQHLVSTVTGRLRKEVSHLDALAACFPGGSISGAPKLRALEIIDELEPLARGPYTGALGYLGFNQESQLAIAIRTAVCREGQAHFHVGAGIVADSVASAEYDETLAKAAGFLQALDGRRQPSKVSDSKL